MIELIVIPCLHTMVDLVSFLPVAIATLSNRNIMQTTYES